MIFTGVRRVAIANSQDAAIALQSEGEFRTGIRDNMSFDILNLNGDYCQIPAIGTNLLAIGL